MGKHVFGHHLAGTAPGGVRVYKNGFFLLFGFGEGFYPGAVEKLNALRRYKTDQGEKNDQCGAYLLHRNDFKFHRCQFLNLYPCSIQNYCCCCSNCSISS